ncbi:glycosyltransferase family 2 protein [Bacteroides fragilis]
MQNIDTPPLVSIFCITYNHSSYIRQCLDGFLIQKTNFPFEVLIHDDASTDDTAGIIKEYEAKYPDIIKPIYQVENQYSKGLDINIVYNLPRARGKYIAMCEGDDYWIDPLKLQNK